MSEELKPCPFCGGDVEIAEGMNEAWVSCSNKQCGMGASGMFSTRKKAIAAWNTRAHVNEW